jgi:hypothetical protein
MILNCNCQCGWNERTVSSIEEKDDRFNFYRLSLHLVASYLHIRVTD